jgi:hypothetical protein
LSYVTQGVDLRVKALWIFFLAAAILGLSMVSYRSCGSGSQLNVDPHARKEIQKAKER